MPAILVDARRCEPADLAAPAAWLHAGGVVAVPTDTFYGLAADPWSAAAVETVFDLKGRAATAALPIVGASLEQIDRACGPLTGTTRRLAELFWPGPLSLIVEAPPGLAAAVHGGTGTVAVRVPAHAVTRALAAAAARPLTATSANRSGEAPATERAGLGDLAADPRVFVVDAGTTAGGEPSTIVDARGAPRRVRAGTIAWERVLESLRG